MRALTKNLTIQIIHDLLKIQDLTEKCFVCWKRRVLNFYRIF